ncbi:hypothetical protein HYW94_02370 [Candidatus Uhrbacteria bacterium]|nr:hypothetical protein [Candidatus Uhrbacteria bacterium]
MALNPEEKLQDFWSETKHAIDPIQRLREGILYAWMTHLERFTKSGKMPEEVRKDHLKNALTALQQEAVSTSLDFGIIECGSPAFQDFLTTIHAIFTPEQIRKFREDARPRFGVFEPLAGPKTPTKKELDDSKNFFQNKFKNYRFKVYNQKDPKHPKDPEKTPEYFPDSVILAQHALESRHMRQILARLLSEKAIAPGTRGDLQPILRRNRKIGADIGMILLIKEQLDAIERAQESKLQRRRAFEGISRGLQEDVSAIFSKDLEGILKQTDRLKNWKNNNIFFTALSVPLVATLPILRAIFAIPRSLMLGARDMFVLTRRGNKRPIS